MRPVAQIAQSVEQGIENPRVGGSIPSLGTINTEKPLHRKIQGFFIGRDLWVGCPAKHRGLPSDLKRAVLDTH